MTISGRPRLLPNGPHAREPDVYGKPAGERHFTWGLRRLEKTLDVRALGETLAPGHRFYLDEVEIQAPSGVAVKLTKQPLDRP